jgi:hypothetical protein
MQLSDRAAAYHRRFPSWPAPRTDSRWLDAVWILGNDYRGTGFYGSYPPGYLRRIQSLFPDVTGRVLHLFSGSLTPTQGHVRVDLLPNRQPDVVGDAHHLPFGDGTFELVLADPPYSATDAQRYGTPMPNRRRVLAEVARVTASGGNLVWLDTVLPMFAKRDWHWWGAVSVVRSTNHRVRLASMFRRV